MSTNIEIVIGDRDDANIRGELEDRLYAFNEEQTGYHDGRVLSCCVHDSSNALVVGATEDTPRGYRELIFQKPLSRDA